jgi:hypothetical protein
VGEGVAVVDVCVCGDVEISEAAKNSGSAVCLTSRKREIHYKRIQVEIETIVVVGRVRIAVG